MKNCCKLYIKINGEKGNTCFSCKNLLVCENSIINQDFLEKTNKKEKMNETRRKRGLCKKH
jgi:hypothetical protein